MRSTWGALAVILVLAFALSGLSCKGDSNPVNPPPPGADVTIQIVADAGSAAFSPSPDTVTVGQTVSWHNGRGTPHTSTANGGQWNTGNIAAGATSAPIQMNTAGPFGYHCTIHPSMTGILVVK